MSQFEVIDITALSPEDKLVKAAKAAIHDYYNYDHYEKSEQIIAELREAIRCVELKPREGGWIVWAGGSCPVEPESVVDISRACGEIETNVIAGHYSWGHHAASAGRDITAFRLIKGEWSPA